MMHETDFPTVEDIAEQLASQTSGWSPEPDADEEGRYLDVRLQVKEDGSWSIHTGSAQYDTSHLGFWGASSISPDNRGMEAMRAIAQELLDEAMEDAWQAGGLDESEDGPLGTACDSYFWHWRLYRTAAGGGADYGTFMEGPRISRP